MKLTIDGVNILPFVDGGGIKWQRNDVDSPDAGRTLDGRMFRARVATKMRLEVSCKPLSTAQTKVLLNLIRPEFVTVAYTDPMEGEVVKIMYSNNVPATAAKIQRDGSVLWEGIRFPLVER